MPKYFGVAIVGLLVFSGCISTLQANTEIMPQKQIIIQNNYGNLLPEKSNVLEHKISAGELEQLRNQLGISQQGANYNQYVDGHGTGLSPPTEDEWNDISQNAYFVDSVSIDSPTPNAVDMSATPWFPPIGNQANQGSCVAWSIGYYIKSFQEAKEHNWNISAAKWEGGFSGYPSLAYQDEIMSPAFVYNLINDGQDGGSSFYEAIQLACFIGVSSWAQMPYSRLDYTSWPSEEAWAEASYYRGNSSGYQYLNVNTNAGIDNLKNWIASENLAAIAVDANLFYNLTNNDLWTLDNYQSTSTNHAATIVGYDDNFTYTEAGQTQQGAFKIANSWGVGFKGEKVADGFYWISYETMKQRLSQSGPAMLFFDSINYQPTLLASFKIVHISRSDCAITVGLGTPNAQIKTKSLTNYVSGGSLPFPSNNIVLDISEFTKLAQNSNQPFFLKVYDGGTSATGSIAYFSIGTTNATGVPLSTKQSLNVYVNLTYSLTPPSLTVSPTSGSAGELITLSGQGFPITSTFASISYLNPENSSWIPLINNLTITNGTFTRSFSAPDLLGNNAAGDNPPLSDNIVFQVLDFSNNQTCNTTVPYIEWRRGLSQFANATAQGLYGNNTNFEKNIFVKNGESIILSGSWFAPGNISVLWDNATILGVIFANDTGFFNATLNVPNTSPGIHTLNLQNNKVSFSLNLTRLPMIIDNYTVGWRNAEFMINLIPDYPLNETFYRINDGEVFNVSSNGFPLITDEGTNNKLEYWGAWDVYGAGVIDLPHVIISGILLDKTAPVGTIVLGSTNVTDSTIIFGLNAIDNVSGVAQMRFSNENIAWSTWEPYTEQKTWVLSPSEGSETVNVQFMDAAGLISPTYSCTITASTSILTPSQTESPTVTPSSTPSSTVAPTAMPTETTKPSSTPNDLSAPPIPQVPEINFEILFVLLIGSLITLSYYRKRNNK